MSLTDEDKSWITQAIGTAIQTSETRLMAAIEKVETSLLTEFHKWASPMEMRARSHSLAIRALDLEGRDTQRTSHQAGTAPLTAHRDSPKR
jgi:hypothetical protein